MRKSVQQFVLKMRRNGRNLERFIIKVWENIEIIRKCMGMQILLDSQAGYVPNIVMARMMVQTNNFLPHFWANINKSDMGKVHYFEAFRPFP